MKAVFVDPSVLLVAVGADHPRRRECRALLEAAARKELHLHLSVEGGQEFLFHRLRVDDRERALTAFDALDRIAIWHPFDVEVLRESRRLVATGQVRGRDAVHAATALLAGFTQIVSIDDDFDGITGLRRMDPSTT